MEITAPGPLRVEQPPGVQVLPPPAVDGNAYFEALRPGAFSSMSLREPYVHPWKGGQLYPNSHVTHDPVVDAGRWDIGTDEWGTPLSSDITWYFNGIDGIRPTGGDQWLFTWDDLWDQSLQVAHDRARDQGELSWNNAKVTRFRGVKVTHLKVEMGFGRREPYLAERWSQLGGEFMVADGDPWTRLEPMTPTGYDQRHMMANVWQRIWILFTEGLPLGNVKAGRLEIWVADEHRDPLKVADGPCAVPWDPESGRGFQSLHLRWSPKDRPLPGPAYHFWRRNFLALKNPGPIEGYLERPRA